MYIRDILVVTTSPVVRRLELMETGAASYVWHVENQKESNNQGYSYFTFNPTTLKFLAQKNYDRFEKLPPGYYSPEFTYQTNTAAFTKITVSSEETILIGGVDERIYRIIEKFKSSKEKYRQFGLPYKRGILLHGKPGCGKSKIITRLISLLTSDGAIGLKIDSNSLDSYSDYIKQLRQINADTLVFLVVEDIEKVLENYEVEMLEILDGATNSDNQIIIASTNNLDEIPDRIKNRPSRIDLTVEIPEFSDNQAAEFVRQITTRCIDSKYEREELVSEILSTDIRNAAKLKELVLARAVFDEPIKQAADRISNSEIKSEK